MYRLMKLSMGYVKWEKKQGWYVNYTRLAREQNECVCEHTHALTPDTCSAYIISRRSFHQQETGAASKDGNYRIDGPEIREGALFLTLCSFEPFDF